MADSLLSVIEAAPTTYAGIAGGAVTYTVSLVERFFEKKRQKDKNLKTEKKIIELTQRSESCELEHILVREKLTVALSRINEQQVALETLTQVLKSHIKEK